MPKYVLVSDFARFRLYDLDEQTEHEFTLAQLPDRTHLFGFISGYTRRTYQDQDPVNVQVAEKMGELHDALLESGYTGHRLEQFLVRLIYCLFAALDAAVDACYRSHAFKTDLDRLKFLFTLYREYTAPLTAAATVKKTRRKS